MPQPFAFYPLNARYKTAEKENRQPKGILEDVAITNGPYNEPGGAYMFYGTDNSYIAFPNRGGLDTRFSITLMCWVQPGHYSGPLITYHYDRRDGVQMWIVHGKFYNQIVKRTSTQPLTSIRTAEVFPVGKWVHVAASYDHNTGNNTLYINGHFSVSQNIGKGYEIATTPGVLMVGRHGRNNASFKGKIAEMKVYDVALNEAQIQTSIRQGS